MYSRLQVFDDADGNKYPFRSKLTEELLKSQIPYLIVNLINHIEFYEIKSEGKKYMTFKSTVGSS